MSLRNYLFSLIGSLILFLSIFQMAFIFWAQNNFEQQVKEKAEQVSMELIDFAVDNFNSPNFRVITNDSKNANKHFVIETKNLRSDVVINYSSNKVDDNVRVIDVNQIRESLHESVQKLHKNMESNQDNYQISEHRQWQFNSNLELDPNSKINNFVNMVILVIVLSTILALGFAFWLSGKFSQPMQALSQGFRHLADGDSSKNVIEQGVEETRQTIRDFNAMKDKLQQLSVAEKALQEKSHLAELGEVSLGLAHALRNPIHTIGLSVEQLNTDTISNEKRQHFVDKIQAKISRIDKTIRALLTLTTTGIQRTDTINILAVIQDILLEYKAGDNLGLRFKLDIDKNLLFIGSENEIRAILHTLIINACEASSEKNTITIKAERQNKHLNVTVLDQGKGLTDKIKNDLFQPHTTSKTEGSGMGLYIAQRLTKLFYDGNISLKNNDNGGCIAHVTFLEQGSADE